MHLRSSSPSALGLPSSPKRQSQGAQSIAKKKEEKKKIWDIKSWTNNQGAKENGLLLPVAFWNLQVIFKKIVLAPKKWEGCPLKGQFSRMKLWEWLELYCLPALSATDSKCSVSRFYVSLSPGAQLHCRGSFKSPKPGCTLMGKSEPLGYSA